MDSDAIFHHKITPDLLFDRNPKWNANLPADSLIPKERVIRFFNYPFGKFTAVSRGLSYAWLVYTDIDVSTFGLFVCFVSFVLQILVIGKMVQNGGSVIHIITIIQITQ